MGQMVKEFQQMKHFNVAMFVLKAFVENYVETSSDPKHPSLVDIGPVNTIFSHNFVDGFRLRASAQTTANLNPHLFAKGYVAYGFKDHRLKGMGELTYAFKKRAYSASEFPLNNISASNGFGFDLQAHRERDEGVGALFYQPLNGNRKPSADKADHERYFNTTDLRLGLTYSPGAKYVNTKQRRILVNNEAPIFTLSHTMGVKMLGGEHNYNFTEATAYKRVWLPSAWGRMDFYFKAGAQWNKVPYPLLIMPAANLSYVVHKGTFCMINNMEFLNDRYASLMINWDINGKIFNRIPLLRKLKWREVMGVNALWGTLTDKNNPSLHPDDADLYYFPGHFNCSG